MHMADALVSPAVGASFWLGSLTALTYAAKKLKKDEEEAALAAELPPLAMNERLIPLMGVLGAFIFAGQMINFTIPGTGSGGHIGGGMILTILLGPYAAFMVIASVLTIQALFFADGGLLSLGANIWNLGIYPCFIAYPFIYRVIVRNSQTPKRIMIASIVSVVAALELGALSVVLQTKLSGITELPFASFVVLMLPIHLAIGLVEGFVTAGVVNYVKLLSPDIMERVQLTPSSGIKRVVIALAILALLTGGVFSWFASACPDGLEWSIERAYGQLELPERMDPITKGLSRIQKKIAVFSDYTFGSKPEEAEESWPAIDSTTSISGLLGGSMVLGLVMLAGFGIRAARRVRQKT